MTRANIRVRPAEQDDVPGLVELTQSVDLRAGTFSGRPLQDSSTDHLTERFTQIVRNRSRVLLVAVDEHGGVTGLLAARPDEIGAIDLSPVLHVSHLLVSPASRRRGVGRMLLSAAVQLAEDRGMDHVLATAASGSREANRYLARLGFAPLVTRRVAPTSVLRRTLGMSEPSARRVVVRRRARMRAGRGISVQVGQPSG